MINVPLEPVNATGPGSPAGSSNVLPVPIVGAPEVPAAVLPFWLQNVATGGS